MYQPDRVKRPTDGKRSAAVVKRQENHPEQPPQERAVLWKEKQSTPQYRNRAVQRFRP